MDYPLAARMIAQKLFVDPNATATLDVPELEHLAEALDLGGAIPAAASSALSLDQLSRAAAVIDAIKNPPAPPLPGEGD